MQEHSKHDTSQNTLSKDVECTDVQDSHNPIFEQKLSIWTEKLVDTWLFHKLKKHQCISVNNITSNLKNEISVPKYKDREGKWIGGNKFLL